MMKAPMISVVIPTLNEEKYLGACLESFKRQTFKDFELIVADGASTDATLEIAKRYTNKILINSTGNVCQQRDAGLRTAKGEIIVGADADTLYPNNYLETIYSIFRNETSIVLVTGRHVTADGPLWAILLMRYMALIIELIYKKFGILVYAPAFCISYRKNVFIDLGGYNVNLDFGGDELDVLYRLKKVGKVVYSFDFTIATSGRRFKAGFLYFLKHITIDYWLNFITAKIFGKSIIKAKPIR